MSTVGVLTRWHVRGTLTNPEQLLLLIIFPLAALVALMYTPLGSRGLSVPGLLTLALMGAAFTSPAITWAFEREQGTWALLASAPISRVAWLGALLISVLMNVLVSVTALLLGLLLLPERTSSALQSDPLHIDPLVLVTGLVIAVAVAVSWASAFAGRMRATAVLALANVIFVLAILFGGILVPAEELPWSSVALAFPPGAAVAFFSATLSNQSIDTTALFVLIAWLIPGVALGSRMWRWR